MVYIIFSVIILAGSALFLRRRSAYYDKVFSDDHYAEIGNWLHSVLKLGPVHEPRLEDLTAFESSGGCGFTFTREVDENDTIHIAISQVGTVTLHAVCSHLAFLITEILKQNEAYTDFFYSESHVHHLLFKKRAGAEWTVNEVAAAIASMGSYQPTTFRFESLHGA